MKLSFMFGISLLLLLAMAGGAIAASVDYTAPLKTISFRYGLQEKERGQYFVNNYSTIGPYFSDLGTYYNRVWVINGGNSRIQTVPLLEDCVTYDYTNLTDYIGRVLNLSEIPYIDLAYAPKCLSSTGTSSDSVVADDFNKEAGYYANITKYYQTICSNGTLTNCGNFLKWHWAIRNEPMASIWWGSDNNYTRLFSITQTRLRGIIPGIVLGAGYSNGHETTLMSSLAFSERPDFIVMHNYGDASSYSPNMVQYNGSSVVDFLAKTSNYATSFAYLRIYKPNIEVFNDEYNLDYRNSPTSQYTRTQEGAAWYSSVLMWEMIGDWTGENWFYGTDTSYGLWNYSLQPYPTYNAKSVLSKRFTIGESLYTTSVNDSHIEVWATRNNIMVINKNSVQANFDLNLTGITLYYLKNESNVTFQPVNNVVSLTVPPYGIQFYTEYSSVGGLSFDMPPTPANKSILNDTGTINISVSAITPGTYSIIPQWDNTLQHWYRFNNDTGLEGATFTDYGSFKYNLTNVGSNLTLNSGKFGLGLNMSNLSSQVFSSNRAWANNTPFTLAMWVYTPDGNTHDIFDMESSDQAGGFRVSITANHPLIKKVGGGFDVSQNASWVCVANNTWTFVVWNYDGNGNINWYCNMTYQTKALPAPYITRASTAIVRVGSSYGGSWGIGKIDDVMYFNRTLNLSTIYSIYNASAYKYSNIFGPFSNGTLHSFTAYSQDLGGNVTVSDTLNYQVGNYGYAYSVTMPYQYNLSTTNAILNFVGIGGIANFTDNVPTNTITINSLTPPNNDVYNVSNGQMLALNVNNYSVTLGAGQQINVGNINPTASCVNNVITANVPDGQYNASYLAGTAALAMQNGPNAMNQFSGWLPVIFMIVAAIVVVIIVNKYLLKEK
jgi:hypothetical protein